MNKRLPFGLLFAALCSVLTLARAQAADEGVETRTVALDARVVKVRIDGIVNVRLRQGPQPSLQLIADKRTLDSLLAAQSGDTLQLGAGGRGMRINQITGPRPRAELVLPSLRQVVSEGVGSTEISGFSGQDLELILEGAGSIDAVASYQRVRAALGGVGKLTLTLGNNDKTDLDLGGAGNIVLNGRSKLLKARLGGVGGLNAQQFEADSVDIDLSGLGNASVNARSSARLNLSGLGSVTVYGKPPQRDVAVDGLGKVSWK